MEPLPENFKASAQAPPGLGVAILRQRILEAGGLFEIESLPGGIVVGAAVPRKALGPKDLITEKSTKAPEGATAGAGSGVLIGGALGWLAGIGALALPGLGPFIAAGPIMATLAGLGVGGVVGGITGALIGVGIPEYEAKRYEGRLTKGGILISIHSDKTQDIAHAREIMERTGGEDISVSAEETPRAAKTAS